MTDGFCKIAQLEIGPSLPYLVVDLVVNFSQQSVPKTTKGSESHSLEQGSKND